MAILQNESTSSASVHHANSAPRTNKGGNIILPENFTPGPHTVVCGRGKVCSSAEGNKRLKTIVDSFLKPYSEAKNKLEKSAIVSTIVNKVKQSTTEGAFVKLEDGRYWEVEDGVSREKVGCMLRDCLHSQYRSSTKSKLARRRANKANEGNQTGMQVPFFGGSHHRNFYYGNGSGLNFSNHSSNTNCGLDFSNHSTNSYEMNFSNHNSSHTSEFDYSNHSGLDYSNHNQSRSSGLDFDISFSGGLDCNSSFANGLDFSNHDQRNSGLNHSNHSNRVCYPEEEMSSSSAPVFATGPISMNNVGYGSTPNPLGGMLQHQPQQQQQQQMPFTGNHSSHPNSMKDLVPLSAHMDIMGVSADMISSNNSTNLVQRSLAEACNVVSRPTSLDFDQNDLAVTGGYSNNDNNLYQMLTEACEVTQSIAQSGPGWRNNGFTASHMTIDEEIPEDFSNIFDDF